MDVTYWEVTNTYLAYCIQIQKLKSNKHTRILFSKPMAVGCPVIHNPTKCLDSCWSVSKRVSVLWVNMAICRCLGRAPSANESSCIFADTSESPSYKWGT